MLSSTLIKKREVAAVPLSHFGPRATREFGILDINGDGCLDSDEIKQVFQVLVENS